MNDHDLDKLLSQASMPKSQRNFRSDFFVLNKNIVSFPQRRKPTAWLIGLPLAASLMLGVWLGSQTEFSLGAITSVAVADDSASNVDDLMSLIESDV